MIQKIIREFEPKLYLGNPVWGILYPMKKYYLTTLLILAVHWGTFVASASQTNVICEVTNQLLPDMFNVITYAAPRTHKISELGLKEAGLHGDGVFLHADEIRIFADKSKMNESPKARIWINTNEGNRYWFRTDGVGSAEDFVIQVGNVVVVYTRASQQPIAWKNIFADDR